MTLGVWKQKAREQQTVYKELHNAGLHRTNGGPTDLQKKWANRLGLKSYQTPAQRATNPTPRYIPPRTTNSQVVPMDVDAGAMGNPPPYQGRGQQNRLESPRGAAPGRSSGLTEAEQADLVTKNACFKCQKPGHRSRDCYSHQQTNPIPENARASGSIPTADATTSEADRRACYNELGSLEGIYNLVKDGPEKDKEKFVDMVQDF